jgi:hypothetical protein
MPSFSGAITNAKTLCLSSIGNLPYVKKTSQGCSAKLSWRFSRDLKRRGHQKYLQDRIWVM